MAKNFPDINESMDNDSNTTRKPRSVIAGERLESIGKILGKQAKIKEVQDLDCYANGQ